MIELRQSTASQEIPLGQFVDDTDGKTPETGLTIANTDIKIWVSGATTLANKNSGGATHISNGIYHATLDATDTATIGPMVIFVSVAGALMVRLECVVLHANVFDVRFGSIAPSTFASGGIVILADASLTTAKLGTFVLAKTTNITGFNDIAATDIVSGGAITTSGGAALADITASSGNALAAATAAQITTDHGAGSYIRNTEPLDAAGIRTAVGLATANLDTQIATLSTGAALAEVKAKTDQMNFGVTNRLDVNVTHQNETLVIGTGVLGDLWKGSP